MMQCSQKEKKKKKKKNKPPKAKTNQDKQTKKLSPAIMEKIKIIKKNQLYQSLHTKIECNFMCFLRKNQQGKA